MVNLPLHKVQPLVDALQGEFYCGAGAIRDALRLGRSFNLIRLASGLKFDLFPLKPDPCHQLEFARSRPETIHFEGEMHEAPVASVEDCILTKLDWFRTGGEQSERQWRDVSTIIETHGDHLDRDYLGHGRATSAWTTC